nr:unnamed protein product [Callosobruchus analis]
MYKPPNVTYKSLSALEISIEQLAPIYNNIICMGDFNIDFANKGSPSMQFLSDILNDFQLSQVINNDTRVTNSTRSLIDIVMVSNNVKIPKSGTVNLSTISDHYLVYFCVECLPLLHKPKYIQFRDLKNLDFELLQQVASNQYWLGVVHLDDINAKVNYLYELIQTVLNICAPIKNIKISKPFYPWITPVIRLMMRLRNKAYFAYKKSIRDSKWIYYKQLRNLVTASVRREKKAFIEYQLHRNNNPRSWWKAIKHLGINCSKIDNLLVCDVNPNSLNNFFVDNVPNIPVNDDLLRYYNSNVLTSIDETFNFTLVTDDEVLKIFNQITTTATGLDGLNINLLSLVFPYCLRAVTHIVNYSLEKGTVPQIWKSATVIPLPKTDNPESLNDYRPISILPVLSKILERIVYKQIVKHINRHSILPSTQSGFRSGHSTTSTLADVCDDYLAAMDVGSVTTAIMIDLSKAFDSINHQLLISKLHHFGFSESSVIWFSDYLSNRTQCVKVDGSVSALRDVSKGVPQGSILGPVLFTLYVSDLNEVVKHCKMHSYADDTQLYLSYNPAKVLEASLNLSSDLGNVCSWFNSNGLKVNPKKSVVITFKSKNSTFHSNNVKFYIDGREIEHMTSVRNLGVLFDEHLTFHNHVSRAVQSAYAKLRTIYDFRNILSKNTKIKLTNSLILSKLEYADLVIGPCLTQQEAFRLQKVQNSCVRYVSGIPRRDRISRHIRDINWLTMQQRWIVHLLSFIQAILNNRTPAYLFNKLAFRSQYHKLNLRRVGITLNIPPHKTNFVKKSFSYMASSLYNELPASLRSLSVELFKIKVKDFILNDRHAM